MNNQTTRRNTITRRTALAASATLPLLPATGAFCLLD